MSSISGSDVRLVIVACEAGMGSSVMVANMIAKQLKSLGIKASHSPVNQLASSGADLVLCHRGLSTRAKQAVPEKVVIPFDMFLGDPAISSVIQAIKDGTTISDG
jgi:mannitol-specific phosphotransferase system IIBC component